MNSDAHEFLSDLGRRITPVSGEFANFFPFQRISVALSIFNSVLLHKSFVFVNRQDV